MASIEEKNYNSSKCKKRKIISAKKKKSNDTVFVVTLAKENEYHDHEVLEVFRSKLNAMHYVLLSDEISEMCKELDADEALFQDYANYILQEHTSPFIKQYCSKLYEALMEHFASQEKCFYWFHIAGRIIMD